MKKVLFGIFAHPDDEAFGPSGTLLLETKAGTELHLITLTAGENGANPDDHQDLGDVRLAEWKKAGALIGATSMHHLGYEDGTLGNIAHVEAAERIEMLIRDTVAGREDIEIELMSMDLNGITGHIDHIVASRSAHLVFYRLRNAGIQISQLRLVCIPKEQWEHENTDFVFMEAGRTEDEIDEIVDARHERAQIEAIIRTHHTQRGDGETHIKSRGDLLGLDYFIVTS